MSLPCRRGVHNDAWDGIWLFIVHLSEWIKDRNFILVNSPKEGTTESEFVDDVSPFLNISDVGDYS